VLFRSKDEDSEINSDENSTILENELS
jgi:hypothetical protein